MHNAALSSSETETASLGARSAGKIRMVGESIGKRVGKRRGGTTGV